MWRFHSNCGQHIKLSSNDQTATFTGDPYDYCDGVIVGNQPMEVNVVYEVQLDQKNRDYNVVYCLHCGVVRRCPTSLVTDGFDRAFVWNRNQAVVFSGSGEVHDGDVVKKDQALEAKLRNLSEGDSVGVTINADGRLHLLVNGRVAYTWCNVATSPCYPFFELDMGYPQVTTRLQYSLKGRCK